MLRIIGSKRITSRLAVKNLYNRLTFCFLTLLVLTTTPISVAAAVRCEELIAQLNQAVPAIPKSSNQSVRPRQSVVEKRLKDNNFKITRGLEKGEDPYTEKMKAKGIPSIIDFFQKLPPDAIVVDSGAGEARALRESIRRWVLKTFRAVAVSFAKPQDSSLEADLVDLKDRLQYIDGDYIQNMIRDPNSKIQLLRGQVNLLIEVFGPVAYAENFTEVFQNYADLLKVGGEGLIQFGESETELRLNGPDGQTRRATLRELSQLIPIMTGGRLKVVAARINRTANGAPNFLSTVFWLKKVSDENIDPFDPFEQVSIMDGHPPYRIYNVNIPPQLDIDQNAIRRNEIRREDSRWFPLQVPNEFNW